MIGFENFLSNHDYFPKSNKQMKIAIIMCIGIIVGVF